MYTTINKIKGSAILAVKIIIYVSIPKKIKYYHQQEYFHEDWITLVLKYINPKRFIT